MTDLMEDLDRLLGSSDGFLLGGWVGDARKVTSTLQVLGVYGPILTDGL
jgi:hypothetical protein